MRELSQQVMDAAMEPSWSTPSPPSGSRASNAVAILTTLKRYLLAEKGRAMLPSEESAAGTDLLMRLVKLEARIREGADNDERVSGLEGEVWRLALAVQEYARRYHLMLAQPDLAMAKVHAKPKSLFLSGGEALLAAAKELSAREEIELFERPTYGDTAQERWNQLSSASVGVFDIGVPEGAEQAQVCYELGLALALGKPSVVTTRPGRRTPFDVNLQPIKLSGDRTADADALGKAIEGALGSIVWGGAEAGVGAGPRDALVWLHHHFRRQLSAGEPRVAMELAEKAQGDAVAFRRSLEQLLGMLGADAPAILLAAWPAAYPDPTERPRCFHVMPFGASWSMPTRDLAVAVCRKNGWTYTRGDEAAAQRIIRGIWDEIGRASAVLVDITGHNANVALELGIVHALGHPYYLVAQDDPKKHMFPSIAKVQVHSYDSRPPFARFEGHVEGLLSSKRQ
jgi:nucleoside 2-deoxyribosyltransferase